MDRRDFLRYAGMTLGGISVAKSSLGYLERQGLLSYPGNDRLERTIRELNAQRAYGILLTNGPQAVVKLGLENYLADSIQEKLFIFSGATVGAYTFSQTQLGQLIAHRVVHSGKELADKLYEGWMRLYTNHIQGKLTRREMIAYIAISGILSGCVSKTPSGPSDGGGSGTATLSGKVQTLDERNANKQGIVNGTIDFLDGPDGNVVATGPLTGGTYKIENVQNPQKIKRPRIWANGAANVAPPFLTTERNAGRTFGIGENTADYVVLDRKQGLPDFYNRVNREVGSLIGLKKVINPLAAIANANTQVGGTAGNTIQTPEQRIQFTNNSFGGYTTITGFSGPSVLLSSNPPSPGGGNLIIDYTAGGWYNLEHLSGFVIDGGKIAIPSISLGGISDRIEIDGVSLFIGEDNSEIPSIANNSFNPGNDGNLHPVDFIIITASKFETLGSRSYNGLVGIIESFERPV